MVWSFPNAATLAIRSQTRRLLPLFGHSAASRAQRRLSSSAPLLGHCVRVEEVPVLKRGETAVWSIRYAAVLAIRSETRRLLPLFGHSAAVRAHRCFSGTATVFRQRRRGVAIADLEAFAEALNHVATNRDSNNEKRFVCGAPMNSGVVGYLPL